MFYWGLLVTGSGCRTPLVSGDSRGDEKFTGKRGEDTTGRRLLGEYVQLLAIKINKNKMK